MLLFTWIQHFQGGFLKRTSKCDQTNFKINFCCNNKLALTQRADPHATAAPPFSQLYPAIFSSAVSISRFGPFWFWRKLCFSQTSLLSSNDVFAKDQVGLKHFPVNEFQISVFWKDPNWKGDKWECALPHILHQNGTRGDGEVALTLFTPLHCTMGFQYNTWTRLCRLVCNRITDTYLMSNITDYCHREIFWVTP